MDTIDGMKVFVSVVSEGSFSRAAAQRNMSPQLVSKYIGQLEDHLGVRLLNRSTRKLSLTESGMAYFDRCRQILLDIDELESMVGEYTVQAKGVLRVNAPVSFGATHLARAISDFRQVQPDVDIDLTLNDRQVDLVSEGFDVAIRISRLKDSSLVARKLAPAKLVVCGAPSYFAKRGFPTSPQDLKHHVCLNYAYLAENDLWQFSRNGEQQAVRVKGPLRANNGDALQVAAVNGIGLILQPTFIAYEDIRAGKLIPVLGDYETHAMGIYAMYAHRQYLSAKVRTFVDFLGSYFGDLPYWDKF